MGRLRDALVNLRRLPRTPFAGALLAIACTVVLANLGYLLGIFEANPLGIRSALFDPGRLVDFRGDSAIDPNNGFISQALSHRAALDWVHGRFPWWNPFSGTGAPLAGEMQSAALFPPTLLALLAHGQLYERMLLEMVAGGATFALLLRLGLHPWAAVLGGIAFALNGTFAWFSHAAMNPVAFLPLALVGVERAYDAARETRTGGWRLLAVAIALSLYAGFPETAYIDGAFVAAWVVWRMAAIPRPRLRALVLKALAGAAVGVLLAAPFLVLGAGFVQNGELGLHENGILGKLHLPAAALPQLLLPYVHGPIFGASDPAGTMLGIWGKLGGFFTMGLVVLALVGLAAPGRRGLKVLLGAWGILALGRMYGLPVFREPLGLFPRMSDMMFFRYAFPTVELSLIVLGALGFDELARRPLGRGRTAVVGGVAAVLLVAAGAGAWPLARSLSGAVSGRVFVLVAVLGATVVLVAVVGGALLRARAWRAGLVGGVVAAEVVALAAAPQLSAPRRIDVDLAPVRFLRQHAGTSRFFTLGPLQPNYGAQFGVASLNNNDVTTVRFWRFVRRRLDRYVDPTVFVGNTGGGRNAFFPSPQRELEHNLAGYRAAGVRWVLAPRGIVLGRPAGAFTLVARTPSTWIYRLAGAAPYLSAPGCRVRPHGRREAFVDCARPATLTRLETALDGWTARVDGVRAQIRVEQGIFQGVSVGAGAHHVRFSYAPPGIGWSLVGLGAGLLALAIPTIRRRRSRGAA